MSLIARRSFITGLLAAPFVVKAASLDMVRGVVMPVRGFIWGKRIETWIDEQMGLSGTDVVGFAVPYAQFHGQYEAPNACETAVLDRLMAMAGAHHPDGREFISRSTFPISMGAVTPDAYNGHYKSFSVLVEHGAALRDQRLVANSREDWARGVSARDRLEARGG
jgi:hypothetical protein